MQLRKYKTLCLGIAFLSIITLLSILAPVIYSINPNAIDPTLAYLRPGSWATPLLLDDVDGERLFIMGTDEFGRDVWSRVLYGGRVSLLVGVAVSLLASFLGLILGLLAGYVKALDELIMRVMDGVMGIPTILLAIAIITVFESSVASIITAISISQVPAVARLVRSITLSITEEPYIEAAIGVNSSTFHILRKHILPFTVAPLLVQGTFICAFAMLIEASLAFLGVGLSIEIPTWGNIIASGRSSFSSYPHLVFLPGIFLTLTILSVNLIGDGLSDLFAINKG